MNNDEILVTGATGKTGRRVTRKLRADGRTVRAASRSGEVPFHWEKPETWTAALAGAGAVYLVAPEEPGTVAAFVERAVAAGVGRFVVLSGRGLDRAAPVGFMVAMAAAERAVRDAGVDWAVIRANNFNQNFDEDLWLEPLRAGRLALPAGAVPEPFVDVEDVAEVAAALLTREGRLGGEVYELSGPRGLTFAEATEVIARAAGRPIAYEELTPEEYGAELLAEGWPPEAVEGVNAMFALMAAGHLAPPADGVARVLGREPVAFEDWAARTAPAGAWAAEGGR
ncbi:NmrA family NAD(P)-binding protein [Streptomyces litchfieldiae]|uniref:NAD(P)H-binding protein n=1 Tax=Streptomyces litchfieldiae TaxID=3075543 RepID=A0ABU2MJE0_9ACTN|nr:NAD(P)H-binding protein [Streptomyces sp. DSM 44938]MDT0341718.1 NAD(P)H-binding protein [Streptomyces sp. DSM 44938]